MSLLSICQQVAQESAIYVPATIVNNSQEDAVRLLALAQAEGKALARRCNWAVLQTEYTFQSAIGTASYSLPSDFRSLLGSTVWNRDQYLEIRGGLTPTEWQAWKSSTSGLSSINQRYRLKAESGALKFFIDPTPTAIEDLVFEYVSNNWCKSSSGTARALWAADDDTGIIDEWLMERGIAWRLERALGHDYQDIRQDYESEVLRHMSRDGSPPVLDLAGSPRAFGFRFPQTGAG